MNIMTRVKNRCKQHAMVKYHQRLLVPFVVCGVLLMSSCRLHWTGTSKVPTWLQREQRHLLAARKRLGQDVRISLSLTSISSFDGKLVLAGGSYRNGAGAYRSALLVSRDGGKSWTDSAVWLYGSEVYHIHFLDEKHAWFVTCWSIEGNQSPYYVFRTVDGAHTWVRSNTSLPTHIEISLSWITNFSFTSPFNGEVEFKSTVGDLQAYETQDGGITWSLKKAEKIAEPDETFYDEAPFPIEGKYKAEADYNAGIIRISRANDADKTWTTIATLPCFYRLNGIELVPFGAAGISSL